MIPPDDVITEAKTAQQRSYSPYSNFKVGAAIRSLDGKIFSGCNIENVSYGLTICAERTAVCAAVSAGYRSFGEMVIVANSAPPCPPCGACRQFLYEFAPELKIWVLNLEGEIRFFRLRDLLPDAFNATFIYPPPSKDRS